MNREIKFRAWDSIKNKLIYNVSLDLKSDWWVYLGESGGTFNSQSLIKISDPIVEQYTGLKDKTVRKFMRGILF